MSLTPWPRLMPGFALLLAGLAAGGAGAQTVQALPTGPNFANPSGIAIDHGGNLFTVDAGNDAVTEIPAAGGYKQAVRLAAAAGNFNGPKAIAVDGAGNLFIADTGNNQVKEIVAAGGYVTVMVLANGAFNAPSGIAVDGRGNVFVADTGNNAVKEIAAAGGYATVTTLVSPGAFTAPNEVAIDSHGNLFVADGSATPVKEVPAASRYATVNAVGSIDAAPTALALDSADNLYLSSTVDLANFQSGSVTEFLAAGGYATDQTIAGIPKETTPPLSGLAIDGSGNVFASTASAGYGPALIEYTVSTPVYSMIVLAGGSRSFDSPDGVAADAAGDVFVTDSSNTVWQIAAADGYSKAVALPVPAGTFSLPTGMAVDHSGNLFVLESGQVKEVLAEGGYSTVVTLPAPPTLAASTGIAIDAAGNLFLAELGANQVVEIPAAGGYASVSPIAVANGHFNGPTGVAVDGSGNVFVTDPGNGVVKEILAADGYVTVNTLPAGGGKLLSVAGVAVDGNGNVFISDLTQAKVGYFLEPGQLQEISQADGYATLKTIAPASATMINPQLVAADPAGNIYVADSGNNIVKKFLLAPSPLAAAVLPGSRAVQAGSPATVFATMLNAGSSDLANCQVGLGTAAPAALSASFQTTDPAANTPTGTPDTPVAIAAGGSQSFVLAFSTASEVSDPGQALNFACDGVASAPTVPGVDTVDLDFASAPTQDIITVAATAPQPGVVSMPVSGDGAFAVATYNAGIAGTLTVSVDTGDATLPLTALLCPTDPSNAQCLQPPAASFQRSFAANATPTFSVFLGATGSIPFAPATNRVFVRFKDAAGVTHGSTSVAVDTD